jgi:hypothetical protein
MAVRLLVIAVAIALGLGGGVARAARHGGGGPHGGGFRGHRGWHGGGHGRHGGGPHIFVDGGFFFGSPFYWGDDPLFYGDPYYDPYPPAAYAYPDYYPPEEPEIEASPPEEEQSGASQPEASNEGSRASYGHTASMKPVSTSSSGTAARAPRFSPSTASRSDPHLTIPRGQDGIMGGRCCAVAVQHLAAANCNRTLSRQQPGPPRLPFRRGASKRSR